MSGTTNRKAKPSPADLEAATRLRALWDEAARWARTRGEQPLTQEAAAGELGINQSAVSQYLNGLIPLNYRAVLGFASLLGIEPSAIRTDLPEQQIGVRVAEGGSDYAAWADIQGYQQHASLGDGSEPNEYAETHKLKFRAESLRRKGLKPDTLSVYYGRGDSMEPRIRDGDAILFDTSDTKPADGAIFVIQSGPEIAVKRCEIIDDHVFFRSDNPNGNHAWRKPRSVSNKRNPITIIGKVRWIGSWQE